MQYFIELTNHEFMMFGRTYTLGDLILVPVVALLGSYLIRWTDRRVTSRLEVLEVDRNLILLIHRIMTIGAYLGLGLILLSLLEIPLTAFAFISGAVAIGVGFGAQNIFNNFISVVTGHYI